MSYAPIALVCALVCAMTLIALWMVETDPLVRWAREGLNRGRRATIHAPGPTARGFTRADFEDANGDACSIQESSVATEPMLWLGQNSGTHHRGKCLARMHLTRDQVRDLLPLLHHFVETGSLPDRVTIGSDPTANRREPKRSDVDLQT